MDAQARYDRRQRWEKRKPHIIGFSIGMAIVVGTFLFMQWFSYELKEERQERVDNHWRNVEWCHDQGGTVVYNHGQWYSRCLVPPPEEP